MPGKYGVDQRVFIKTSDGGYRPPSSVAKGSYGIIAPQCMADWLALSNSELADPNRTYYVTIEEGSTELIGEDWLTPV